MGYGGETKVDGVATRYSKQFVCGSGLGTRLDEARVSWSRKIDVCWNSTLEAKGTRVASGSGVA